MSGGLVRVLNPILGNEMQGRYRSIWRRDGRWHPAITTMAFVRAKDIEEVSPILGLAGDGIAPLVARGDLDHPRWPEWEMPFWAITELVPDGATVEEVVESQPLEQAAAVRLALRVGEAARRALDRGHDLGGGIRPELVYLRRERRASSSRPCSIERLHFSGPHGAARRSSSRLRPFPATSRTPTTSPGWPSCSGTW
jgi:hypothetical protein